MYCFIERISEPCGAGALIYLNGKNNKKCVKLRKAISKKGTNNIGELYTIWMVFDINK